MADADGLNNLIAANLKWVQEQRHLLKVKEEEISRLQAEYDDIRSKLQPMEEWLSRHTDYQGAVNEKRMVDGSAELSLEKPARSENVSEEAAAEAGLRGDRLRDEVVRILTGSYPESLYYREILNRLEQSGYRVGGKDPGLNLIAHMAKENRIERGEKRGMYRLAVPRE